MTPLISDEAIAAFTSHLRDFGFAENTALAYERDLNRWRSVGNTHAERARAIRASGLAPRTIRRQLASHSKFLQWNAPTQPNPYVRGPSVGLVLPSVVPQVDEMQALVTAEPNLMLRAAWALMAGAGLRVAEVAGLTWACLDGVNIRVLGKGSKVRDVPMSEAVMRVVAEWRMIAGPGALVVPVSVRTLQRHLKAAAIRAGLPASWHPHALRHGFATAVYAGTHDPLTTAELLGHSSLEMCRIYAHISSDTRKSAVEFALPA